MDETAPMATATATAGYNSGGSNYDCGNCHSGDYHCSDYHCDSGGCVSGDSDSNYGNGITAEAIIRLNKALYGLNQAPRPGIMMHTKTDGFLCSLRFTQSHADRNL